MNDLRAVLAGHRSAESLYKTRVRFFLGTVLLFSVLLAVAVYRDWHWFACVMFGIFVFTGLVRGFGEWNALVDRRKLIAKLKSSYEEKA